jgi:enoyl-[acyl-carrier-protein] reductase (NADH)
VRPQRRLGPPARYWPRTSQLRVSDALALSRFVSNVGVATVFLAHDAARLITGETLYIDGGYHIIDWALPELAAP